MAFIVALPAAGIIVYAGLDQRNNAMNNARTESQRLADNIASEQQALVAGTKQLLSALAQLPEIRTGDQAKVHPLLTDILGLNPHFLNIYIADRTGFMWATAKPAKSVISIADRRQFINARDTGQFSSGEYMIGRILGKPTLSFGYPYKDQNGAFAGVICANIDLEYSKKLLQRSKLPTGSSYAFIDHQGMILDRGIDPAAFVGKRDKPERFQLMQGGSDSGSYRGPGLDGSLRFVSYRKLRLDGEQTPYLYIRAGIPVNMAVANANRALFINLALLTPFMIAAFALVWLIAKRSIVDRIATLNSASRRLAAGELDTRIAHLVPGGELGDLGRAFDEMAVKLSREIAESKQAEREIATLNTILVERAAELEHANGELETFSYTISHDLCKPLTVINGYCQVIQELYADTLDPQCRDFFQAIYDGSERMNDLIDALLEFSCLTRIELHTERVDLSGLAREVAEELRVSESDRQALFRIADGLTADGDRKLLRSVMENLLGNAWKYSSIRDEAIIEFDCLDGNGQQLFCVRDNGAGFDMQFAEKLFIPFQRLPGSDEFKGFGIGLATVERIIRRHGGRIWAEGEREKGAVFYFTL
jgi:signal transduction histidine kinase